MYSIIYSCKQQQQNLLRVPVVLYKAGVVTGVCNQRNGLAVILSVRQSPSLSVQNSQKLLIRR